jgi:hypothetical protein
MKLDERVWRFITRRQIELIVGDLSCLLRPNLVVYLFTIVTTD